MSRRVTRTSAVFARLPIGTRVNWLRGARQDRDGPTRGGCTRGMFGRQWGQSWYPAASSGQFECADCRPLLTGREVRNDSSDTALVVIDTDAPLRSVEHDSSAGQPQDDVAVPRAAPWHTVAEARCKTLQVRPLVGGPTAGQQQRARCQTRAKQLRRGPEHHCRL